MKDCFEQLRAKLPANQNNKSSKWETLARGKTLCKLVVTTANNVLAIDYISALEGQNKSTRMELDRQRNQMHEMEMQIKEMSQRLGHPPPNFTHGPTPIPAYNGARYTNGVDSTNDPPRTLPPIINGGAMQGVQYGDERR